jgi:MFS family permease
LAQLGDRLFSFALVRLAVETIGENAAYLTALECAVVPVGAVLGGRFLDALDRRAVMLAGLPRLQGDGTETRDPTRGFIAVGAMIALGSLLLAPRLNRAEQR